MFAGSILFSSRAWDGLGQQDPCSATHQLIVYLHEGGALLAHVPQGSVRVSAPARSLPCCCVHVYMHMKMSPGSVNALLKVCGHSVQSETEALSAGHSAGKSNSLS